MQYKIINHLIELIYEAAIDPEKWYDLLNALAEFIALVDKQEVLAGVDPVMHSVIPGIAAIGDQVPEVSISKSLKMIADAANVEKKIEPQSISDYNELLIGHFARAIKIARRLVDMDEQHEIVLSLLDRLPMALVLVDRQGRVIEVNVQADEILSEESGLFINKGYLCAGDKNKNKIRLAIEAMSKHDPATSRGKTLSLTHEKSSRNMMLFMAPIKQHEFNKGASVAIFISQRKSQLVSLPPELTELYGLTEKEIEITAYLVRGMSIKEIAEATKVSQHTVRSQVKAILRKTETSRQAELVSLVYNGLGSFVRTIPGVTNSKRDGLLSKARPWQQDYRLFELDDGRNIAYQEYGAQDGKVLIHCHGVLGSRLEKALDAEKILSENNIRMIVFDRPGFGVSDPDPENSFIKWADNLKQFLNNQDIQNCFISGYGMGGVYALAAAHQHPELISKVAVIGTGLPAETADEFKQMIPLYRMNTQLAKYIPGVYDLMSSVLAKGVLNDTESFFNQLGEKLDYRDQKILNDEDFRQVLFAVMKEGLKQGGKAASREIIEFVQGWGFNLPDITVPVHAWHGESDYHVPLVLSEKMVTQINNKEIYTQLGTGHYLFYTHWDKIIKALMADT